MQVHSTGSLASSGVVSTGGGASAEAARGGVGLSIDHTPPVDVRTYTFEVSAGGGVVGIKSQLKKGVVSSLKGATSTRGTVRGFSRRSRRRLMRLVASIDKRALGVRPLFLTLTYPGVYSEDWREWKRHHDAFVKALRRKYPTCSLIWRMEAQKRGAPHYHMLVFGVPFIPYDWVAQTWFRVVGSGDPAHLAAGSEVRRVRSWRGVMHYVGKYLAKDDRGEWDVDTGRVWGVCGREHLPLAWLRVEVTYLEFLQLRRQLRRYTQARARGLRYCYRSRFAGTWVIMDWRTGVRLLECIG